MSNGKAYKRKRNKCSCGAGLRIGRINVLQKGKKIE